MFCSLIHLCWRTWHLTTMLQNLANKFNMVFQSFFWQLSHQLVFSNCWTFWGNKPNAHINARKRFFEWLFVFMSAMFWSVGTCLMSSSWFDILCCNQSIRPLICLNRPTPNLRLNMRTAELSVCKTSTLQLVPVANSPEHRLLITINKLGTCGIDFADPPWKINWIN